MAATPKKGPTARMANAQRHSTQRTKTGINQIESIVIV